MARSYVIISAVQIQDSLLGCQRHGHKLNSKLLGNKCLNAYRTKVTGSLSPLSTLRADMRGNLQGNMHVRFMDWQSDLDRLHSQSVAYQAASTDVDEPKWHRRIPQIQEDATFNVVLGSDILYEVSLALVHSPVVSVPLSCSWLTGSLWRFPSEAVMMPQCHAQSGCMQTSPYRAASSAGKAAAVLCGVSC